VADGRPAGRDRSAPVGAALVTGLGSAQRDIACVPAEPGRGALYAEGWQSWSVAGPLPPTAAPPTVTAPESVAIDCQYATAAPPGVHQGAGLLAIDPGDGGPVEIFATVSVAERVPVIQARVCDGYLIVSADGAVTRRTDAGDGGLTGALGRWAAEFAALAGVPPAGLRPVPPVWCSWYQYGDTATDDDILANLRAMDDLELGIGVVQIDDGYQCAPGDWLQASGRIADLPGLAGRIQDSGRRAGLWIAPMLVGRSSDLLRDHPDWVVRDPASQPVYVGTVCRQECTALDVTHPDATAYLSRVLRTMRSWGVDYFKIDFMYAAAYEGRRHEDVTGVQAYQRGLRLIRDAIGPDALLLGCGAPILPSVGLVDAMRVGPDIAVDYEPADGNPSLPSQRAAARNTVARAWQQGRFWVNDPDCLLARPGVQRRKDWAALVERYGGLRSSGDGLRNLDPWGLETTRRLLVPSPTGPIT
jgi:alpha-galactosidase